ncbi:MAG: glycosyltransferase family 4 protein [Raineya sp.]
MPKHILYISYDGLTDPLGQSQILPYIIGLCKQHRYQFSIISAEKAELFEAKKHLIQEQIKDLPISWQPIIYTKKPPVFSTLWDLWRIRKKAGEILQKTPFQLIHARSYLSALIALSFKKKYKIPFIFDMRGFWADERIDGGLWNLKNPVYKYIYNFFKRKEKEFLQEASYTISLTYNAKQEIQNWRGFESTPIQVIPCCVDMAVFCPQPQIAKNKKLTMSYLGSIGTWYLLDEMLIFYQELLKTYPEAIFSFITTEDPVVILQEAKKLALPLAQIQIRKANREQVPVFLAESHFSIFFIKDAYSKKASSATKMAEILAMGIPILTNDIGDHEFLAQKYHFGKILSSLDRQTMQEAISSIPEMLQISAQSLRNIVEEYFDLQKGVDLYNDVYRKVLL